MVEVRGNVLDQNVWDHSNEEETTMRNHLRRLHSQLQEKDEAIKSLEDKVNGLPDQVDNLQKINSYLKEQLADLHKQLEEKGKENNENNESAIQQLTELQERLSAKEEETKTMREELTTLQANREASRGLESRVSELKSQMRAYEKRQKYESRECEKQLRKSARLVADMQSQLEEKEHQLTTMATQLHEFQNQEELVSQLEEQLRKWERHVADMQSQLEEKEHQLTTMATQLHEFQNQEELVSQLEEQLRKWERHVADMQSQLEEKEHQLTTMATQLHEFQNQEELVSQLEEQLRNKEQKMAVMREELSQTQQRESGLKCILSSFQQDSSRDWVINRREIQLSNQELGRGAWGSVLRGTFRGCDVAVKQMHVKIASDFNRHLFEREVDMASKCRHPCLLLFIGASIDDKLPLLVTEIMDCSLRNRLYESEQPPLCAAEVSVISLDVARALNYLHEKATPIIHRDISSGNVLLWRCGNQWRAKVSDYGTANLVSQSERNERGTALYSPPECLTEDPNRPISCKVSMLK